MSVEFRKKSWIVLALAIASACSQNASKTIATPWTISWSFEDAGGGSALNKNSAQDATKASLATFGSTLYAAWVESNGTNTQIRVKSSTDGITWTFADGGGTNGLNISSSLDASSPVMAVSDSKIYLAWTEDDGTSAPQVRVKESADGVTWTTIESGGINVDNTETAADVRLVYFNSKLYAVWTETSTGDAQIRVKRYDGGTTWTSVDGGPLNKVSATTAANPTAFVFSDKLYIAWDEPDGVSAATQIRIKGTSDGTTWAFVDGGGTYGLNVDTTQNASTPRMAEYNSKLFLVYTESNGTKYQIRARSFDGTSWSAADDGGTTGLNASTAQDAYNPILITFNSYLFALWQESNGSKSQIRVKQLSGTTTWSSVDGGETAGLNSSSNQNAYLPGAEIFNSKLFVIWQEQVPTSNIMLIAGS